MGALLWDVQEEHLGEAEFALEAWQRSLDSPQFTITEVLEGPEARLTAHVAGLIVGGTPVFQRLLWPTLERADDDAHRTGVAALAILMAPPDSNHAQLRARRCARLLARLDEVGETGRAGLTAAFQLANRKGIGRALATDLDSARGGALAARLEALGPRRFDAKRRLVGWLDDGDARVQIAAARLCRHTSSSAALKGLLPLARAGPPALREVAIESALIRGLPGSWQAACELALSPDPPEDDARALRAAAQTWVAILGDEQAHDRLCSALEREPSAPLLWAVGLTGRRRAVDLACSLLETPGLERLAGEVVSTVAGLPGPPSSYWLDDGAAGAFGADPDDALPALDDDDLDADLVPSETLALPLPDGDRVRRWWATRRAAVPEHDRWLAGAPLDGPRLAWGLRELPTRRRHTLALELAMRSAGRELLDCRTTRARAQLLGLRRRPSDPALDCQRGLPLLTSTRSPRPWH